MATLVTPDADLLKAARPAAVAAIPRRLDSIQLLRALAASMVVLLHAEVAVRTHAQRSGLPFDFFNAIPLSAGVDLFFAVSGFIIVYASERLFGKPSAFEFLKRRLLRIVPLYWLALGLRLIVLMLGAKVGAMVFPDATMILTSFLFIPYDCQGYGSDYPFPILDLGWSLNYEIFFYLLFACLISRQRQQAVAILCGLLAAAALLGWLFPPAYTAPRFWLRPLTLEFAAGAVVALAYRNRVELSGGYRIALCITAVMIWWLLPMSLLDSTSGPGSYSWARLICDGIPAICLLAAATLGKPPRVVSERPAWLIGLTNLGDSSYALYLLHPFILIVMQRLVKGRLMDADLLWPLVIATVAFAIVAAQLVHKYIEKPLIQWLRELTDMKRPSGRLIPNR